MKQDTFLLFFYMKIHCIRHEPFEGLAAIREWAVSNQLEISYTYTYLEQHFPEETDFDLLIIMGGTASVYDAADLPWVPEEMKFIKRVLDDGKKILGICLGAQLLAAVLGSRIYPGTAKEIGWFSVDFNREELSELDFLPEEMVVFHWHGDTFDLPPGSVRLASSELTPNQGFVFNRKIWGLQFHPEMTREALQNITKGASADLEKSGLYVQSAQQILNKTRYLEENKRLMFDILDFIRKS